MHAKYILHRALLSFWLKWKTTCGQEERFFGSLGQKVDNTAPVSYPPKSRNTSNLLSHLKYKHPQHYANIKKVFHQKWELQKNWDIATWVSQSWHKNDTSSLNQWLPYISQTNHHNFVCATVCASEWLFSISGHVDFLSNLTKLYAFLSKEP